MSSRRFIGRLVDVPLKSVGLKVLRSATIDEYETRLENLNEALARQRFDMARQISDYQQRLQDAETALHRELAEAETRLNEAVAEALSRPEPINRPAVEPWTTLDILSVARLTDEAVNCAKVRMRGATNDAIQSFRRGDTLSLAFHLLLRASAGEQKLVLQCVDSRLAPVWTESLNLDNSAAANPSAGDSKIVVHCRIPLDLPEGFFAFSMSAQDAATCTNLDQDHLGRTGHVHLRLVQFLVIRIAASGLKWEKQTPFFEWRVKCGRTPRQRTAPRQGGLIIAQPWNAEPAPRAAFLRRKCLPESGERGVPDETGPTTIHITHQKAGSQWVYNILRDLLPDHIAEPKVETSNVVRWPLKAGSIYPTVYVTREEYETIEVPRNTNAFLVIRDLRDTLVSLYFSWRYSHPVRVHPDIAAWRAELECLNPEEGLLRLLRRGLRPAAIQKSWLETGIKTFKYEDLVESDVAAFAQIIIDHCRLPVSRGRLDEVVERHRFVALTDGRERGKENVASHYRKGIVGDWRNVFTQRVKDAFKAKYGELLIKTGYENDLSW